MTKKIFTDVDYNSNNGMNTNIWGPCIWFTLHTISFNYPVNPTAVDKVNYKKWLLSFQHTLPCVYCRDNFKNNLKQANFNDSVFKNRLTFSKFIYNLHNCVNKMLGKKIKISYEEVRDRYEHFRSRCVEKIPITNKNPKKEKKCNNPLTGVKSRTCIRIVPEKSKILDFKMDKLCIKK